MSRRDSIGVLLLALSRKQEACHIVVDPDAVTRAQSSICGRILNWYYFIGITFLNSHRCQQQLGNKTRKPYPVLETCRSEICSISLIPNGSINNIKKKLGRGLETETSYGLPLVHKSWCKNKRPEFHALSFILLPSVITGVLRSNS